MYPYFLMIGLPALFSMLVSRKAQTGIALAAVFLLFLFLIGFRYEIGPDWFSYLAQSERYPYTDFVELFEHGEVSWAVLVLASNELGLGLYGMVFASALVFCFGLFSIARVCEEPMLALVAAVPYLAIAVAMSGMRQAIAIGIIFFIISRWYRLSIPAKIGLILLASSFHFSALLMMGLLAFDSRLSMSRKIGAGFLIFALVGWQMLGQDYRMNRYTSTYLVDGSAGDTPGAIFHVLLTAVPAIAYFVYRKRWVQVYGRISIIDLLAAIGILALAGLPFAATATDRMTLYFSAVALIIQANFPGLWEGRGAKNFVRVSIIMLNFLAVAVFLLAGNHAAAFTPYQTIFSESAQLGISRR